MQTLQRVAFDIEGRQGSAEVIPKLAVQDMRVQVGFIPKDKVNAPEACRPEHLYSMLDKMDSGEVAGEKAHRWLGWIQGVVCMYGVSSLERMKEINKGANWDLPSALDSQEGGQHYKSLAIQPVQYMHANQLDYFRGAAVKYVTRDKTKGKAEDIKKVIHFCRIILEMDYGVRSSNVAYEGPL